MVDQEWSSSFLFFWSVLLSLLRFFDTVCCMAQRASDHENMCHLIRLMNTRFKLTSVLSVNLCVPFSIDFKE